MTQEGREQVSIASIIVMALFVIFIFSTILQGISFIVNPTKNMVASSPPPQVAWTLAIYQYLYVVYSYLLMVLSNPYSVAVFIALGIVVLSLTYYWYQRQ
ncbi:MAG: hypothetical protein JHC26_00580 [Thermofilum sp.]|uniref:hypothetical protein n=1 Tax=Thermofilum sp. TaxID=1961369 RepID=UPI002587B1B6|nr:hypothetical protein [Thermofilum sp.]MCI4407561.1 hypothetical protein [Thermofilum sp.]